MVRHRGRVTRGATEGEVHTIVNPSGSEWTHELGRFDPMTQPPPDPPDYLSEPARPAQRWAVVAARDPEPPPAGH